MRLRAWNAVIVSFGLLALISPASADFHTDSEAKFALLGPWTMQAGLDWQVEQQKDESICALAEWQVRERVAGKPHAVKKAALDIWSAAKPASSRDAA